MATGRTTEAHGNSLIVTYAALGAENGASFEGYEYPDKTIQAHGTGTVTLQESPDGTNWEPLNDSAGVAISLDASAQECSVVLENPRHMRAVNAGGTALIVITCVK